MLLFGGGSIPVALRSAPTIFESRCQCLSLFAPNPIQSLSLSSVNMQFVFLDMNQPRSSSGESESKRFTTLSEPSPTSVGMQDSSPTPCVPQGNLARVGMRGLSF